VRTLLITGPGGAGRTTVAAATARAVTRAGQRALVLTADRSRDLDALLGTPLAPSDASGGVPLGPGATAVPVTQVPGLWAARVDAQAAFRAGVEDAQRRLGPVFDLVGADPLAGEELTELPGAEPLALLRALRGAAAPGEDVPWEVVVVDLPPLYAAFRALALPEQLRRYLGRLLPRERQAARALRPVLAQLAGVPMPAQAAYDAAERADLELGAAEAVIRDRRTTVRLVVEPGPRAAETVRTARTVLALYGHRLTDVVANRLLPATETARLAARQREYLKVLDAELAEDGVPLRELPYVEDPAQLAGPARSAGSADPAHPASSAQPAAAADPAGSTDLAGPAGPTDLTGSAGSADLADTTDLAGSADLTGPAGLAGGVGDRAAGGGLAPHSWRVEDRLAADGQLVWRLPLPGAGRDTLDLVRRDDELVVDAEGFRRIIPLPSVLRRCTVAGAALRDGELSVRFAPDPDLWPSQLG
jgi:arsenite/tail-anchored protein-transporting ATPase